MRHKGSTIPLGNHLSHGHCFLHSYACLPCLSLFTRPSICLWYWLLLLNFFALATSMLTSCGQLFSMIKPLFLLKQVTMIIYTFHTWILVFISWHLVHYSACNLEWKFWKIHCMCCIFVLHGIRVLSSWRRRWRGAAWTLGSFIFVLIWVVQVFLSCSHLSDLDLLIPCWHVF